MDEKNATLISLAVEYDSGDPRRIQHFMKVFAFASAIARLEGVAPETLQIIETAAILHDIGIHECERKYGACDGKHQEKEGPAVAMELMRRAGGYTDSQMERVCFLIAHHHTYSNIDGIDWQILVEADFIVNAYEDGLNKEAVGNILNRVFKTETGKVFLIHNS